MENKLKLFSFPPLDFIEEIPIEFEYSASTQINLHLLSDQVVLLSVNSKLFFLRIEENKFRQIFCVQLEDFHALFVSTLLRYLIFQRKGENEWKFIVVDIPTLISSIMTGKNLSLEGRDFCIPVKDKMPTQQNLQFAFRDRFLFFLTFYSGSYHWNLHRIDMQDDFDVQFLEGKKKVSFASLGENFSLSNSATIHIYDTLTMKKLYSLNGNSKQNYQLSKINGDNFIMWSKNSLEIYVYKFEGKGVEFVKMIDHESVVQGISLPPFYSQMCAVKQEYPKCPIILSYDVEGEIFGWNHQGLKWVLKTGLNEIESVSVTNEHCFVLSSVLGRKKVHKFNLPANSEVNENKLAKPICSLDLKGTSSWIIGCGKFLLVSMGDKSHLLETDCMKTVLQMKMLKPQLLKVHSDGRMLLSCFTGILAVLCPNSGCSVIYENQNFLPKCAISSNGRHIAFVSQTFAILIDISPDFVIEKKVKIQTWIHDLNGICSFGDFFIISNFCHLNKFTLNEASNSLHQERIVSTICSSSFRGSIFLQFPSKLVVIGHDHIHYGAREDFEMAFIDGINYKFRHLKEVSAAIFASQNKLILINNNSFLLVDISKGISIKEISNPLL